MENNYYTYNINHEKNVCVYGSTFCKAFVEESETQVQKMQNNFGPIEFKYTFSKSLFKYL